LVQFEFPETFPYRYFLVVSDSIQAVRSAGLPVVIPAWQSLPQSWSTERKKTVCCLGC